MISTVVFGHTFTALLGGISVFGSILLAIHSIHHAISQEHGY